MGTSRGIRPCCHLQADAMHTKSETEETGGKTEPGAAARPKYCSVLTSKHQRTFSPITAMAAVRDQAPSPAQQQGNARPPHTQRGKPAITQLCPVFYKIPFFFHILLTHTTALPPLTPLQNLITFPFLWRKQSCSALLDAVPSAPLSSTEVTDSPALTPPAILP